MYVYVVCTCMYVHTCEAAQLKIPGLGICTIIKISSRMPQIRHPHPTRVAQPLTISDLKLTRKALA